MSRTFQDLSHAIRTLRRRPGFTCVAVGTIALAIAANTAMFSIVYGVLLRPLPFPQPERLVTIDPRANTGFYISNSIPNYRDWRDRSRVFESMSGSDGNSFTLTTGGDAEIIDGSAVVGDFFAMFGMTAELGRVPSAAETQAGPGMPSLVVLSHAFWQARFGGDRSIVGRVLTLSGRPYTVAGVLPAGVGFPDLSSAVYVPLGSLPGLPWDDRNSGFGMRAFARLKPGVALAAARSDLARVGRDMRTEFGVGVAVPELRSLDSYVVGNVTRQLWLLMGAVGFVLLIAVANVGNLLLVRGEERHRELAIRSAIGASRAALARLMLSEALVLSLAGAALGVALAYGVVGALVPLLPADLPAILVPRLAVNGTVLALAVVIALAAGLLFGAIPAWRAMRQNVAETVKSGSRSVAGGRGRLRPALVIAEIALAVVVLIGAGLTLRSLDRLSHVDKGFNASGVLTAAIPAGRRQYPTKELWRGFYDRLRDRAAALPGVKSAAVALLLPLSNRSWELRVYPEGVAVTPANEQSVLYNVVTPEYFDAMQVPIVRGRGFTAADRDGTPLVAMVDESMAQRFWPGKDPIGQRITLEERGPDSAYVYRTVVGVTRNVRHYELDSPSRIQVYVPLDQSHDRWGMNLRLALRTSGPPSAVAPALRAMVKAMDPDAPVYDVRPLTDYVDDALAEPRAMTRVLAAFGAAALALVALGIFAVMSYDVARRTREIAIRMAVGAAARDVFTWVGARALRMTLWGLVLGLVAAAVVSRLMARMLFEVQPLDPLTYGVAAAGLAGVALLAAYLPARRATRVDPIEVLNEE